MAIFEVKGTKNKLSRLDFTEKTIEVYRKAKGIGIETYLMKVVFLDDWKCEVYLDAFKI
ncbi:MAG: hypothetical protein J7L80_02480 [Thermoplasmata archaeon]|nr:hypothetical protein [Thermoplasmata archaeon]